MPSPAALATDLSVIIITLNEEKRLPACLQSLPRGCEVIVLDSFSQDATCELANAAGARVYQQRFVDYAAQKNKALSYATRRWVLSIDADEVLSPELAADIARVCSAKAPQEAVAYRLHRALIFMGRRLRYGKTADRPLRLVLRGAGHYAAAIHESLVLDTPGAVKQLGGVLWHESYDDVSDYFLRFNRYTSAIAHNHFAQGKPWPGGLRHHLRPWFEFVSRYVFRLGFLDGYPGYTYALFSSLYAYVKYAKLRELYLEEIKRS